MINLLYYSHTVVPSHLEELETLGLLERDEQVLVALDGVLLNADNKRLSGPTLHDYCLVTTLRVLLWARDYGGHTCYAFPLTELDAVQGNGLDPLHAQISLTFVSSVEGEEDQRYTLTLVPVANLQAGMALLRNAAKTARELEVAGVGAREAGSEILAVLGEQIYGHVDGLRPGETPYRWPGASAQSLTPVPGFNQDLASLPPERIYAASRFARSAWDTLRRSIRDSIRDADLPFDLSNSSVREVTEAVRAINDLVHTVATNPSAQQMAMAFLNSRQGGRGAPSAPESPAPAAHSAPAPTAGPAPDNREYHEIPLRRRASSSAPAPAPRAPVAQQVAQPTPPDRREIPLRRRGPANTSPRPFSRPPISISGSGDADVDDRR